MLGSFLLAAALSQIFGEGEIPTPKVAIVPAGDEVKFDYEYFRARAISTNSPLLVAIGCKSPLVPCEWLVYSCDAGTFGYDNKLLVMRPNGKQLYTLGVLPAAAEYPAIWAAAYRDWDSAATGFARKTVFNGFAGALDRDEAVVMFTAKWCGPCQLLKPRLLALAAKRGTPVHLVDVDTEPAISKQFGATTLPMVAIVRRGAVGGKIVGNADTPILLRLWER